MSTPVLAVRRLGRVAYREAFALQQQLRTQRLEDAIPDTALVLEHPPVITVTRRFGRQNVLVGDEELRSRGVELVEVDRGGDVTAHMPGQLVVYPIVKLLGAERDLPRYVRALEQSVLDVLATLGLQGQRVQGESGVFLGPTTPGGKLEKVCAVGVKGTRFVMSHGLAFNIRPDLSLFSLIIPCGLAHRGVTSVEARLGPAATPTLEAAGTGVVNALAAALGRVVHEEAG